MCVHAFVNFFFKKTSPQKLLTGLLAKFHSSVPQIVVKIFSSSLQKNQVGGAIQALKRL